MSLFYVCVCFVIPFFALFLCFFYLILFLVSWMVYYKCDCSCTLMFISAVMWPSANQILQFGHMTAVLNNIMHSKVCIKWLMHFFLSSSVVTGVQLATSHVVAQSLQTRIPQAVALLIFSGMRENWCCSSEESSTGDANRDDCAIVSLLSEHAVRRSSRWASVQKLASNLIGWRSHAALKCLEHTMSCFMRILISALGRCDNDLDYVMHSPATRALSNLDCYHIILVH